MTTTINAAGSPEVLYGVPAAAELEALANQLFPDLIGEAAVPSGTVPAAPAEAPAAAPEVPAVGYGIPAGTSFDWEHPFAAAPSGAETEKLSPGYAPVVLSASDAASGKVPEQTAAPGAVTPRGSNDSIRIGSKTLAEIRGDFPILAEKVNGNNLVWLDNGATTQRPQQVIDRISYYYQHENSNVHRGAHTLAARSTDAYENARDIVRDFIGAGSSSEIVFVRGTTEAINLVANAYVKPTLKPGDEIIVSILEHHANIVPWQLIAQKTGAVIRVIPCDETGQLIMSEYDKLFTSRTKFVAVTHVSNVLGTVTPVAELIAGAHRHGVRILIDGAQSVAHIPVNVSALDADFFVFSGHKIYGPTGIGVVYGKKELLRSAEPYHGGGNMIADVTFERTLYNDVPNKFEAGTGSIADAVGLGAALSYLSSIGMPCVHRWEHDLLQYALKELRAVPGLTLVGTARDKASALAFKLNGYSDDEVGRRLDSFGIAVRTGHHCAQPVLRRFGYESAVRPTLGIYNSPEDIDALVRALRSFA
ncbi:SufS family cysteine desulfurase [Succinimonas sp.]|uniref:SufS family cysteine desulfurase n=1 Tax=Succinimonas sp. TaxID=1936151 RepID=UPI00386D3D17